MFYIKTNDCTRIEITADNVFTACPACGKEFPVDLMEQVCAADGDFDLYSTQIYCPACSAQIRHSHKNNKRFNNKMTEKGSI